MKEFISSFFNDEERSKVAVKYTLACIELSKLLSEETLKEDFALAVLDEAGDGVDIIEVLSSLAFQDCEAAGYIRLRLHFDILSRLYEIITIRSAAESIDSGRVNSQLIASSFVMRIQALLSMLQLRLSRHGVEEVCVNRIDFKKLIIAADVIQSAAGELQCGSVCRSDGEDILLLKRGQNADYKAFYVSHRDGVSVTEGRGVHVDTVAAVVEHVSGVQGKNSDRISIFSRSSRSGVVVLPSLAVLFSEILEISKVYETPVCPEIPLSNNTDGSDIGTVDLSEVSSSESISAVTLRDRNRTKFLSFVVHTIYFPVYFGRNK